MKYIIAILLSFVLGLNHSFAETEKIVINNLSDAQIEARETKTNLLLVFTADWCRYCVFLERDLDNNMELINKSYTVVYVDYDSQKNLASKYAVKSLPTSVIVDTNLNLIKTKVGFSDFNSYKRWISQ